MSTTSNTRSAAYNDRRTTASTSTRPRVPPSRADAKQRPTSQDGPLPQTSIADADLPNGNAPGPNRRKGNATFPSERRTEKTQVITKESLQVRTRSRSKRPTNDSSGSGRSWDRDKVRPGSRAGAESSAGPRREHESSQGQSAVTLCYN